MIHHPGCSRQKTMPISNQQPAVNSLHFFSISSTCSNKLCDNTCSVSHQAYSLLLLLALTGIQCQRGPGGPAAAAGASAHPAGGRHQGVLGSTQSGEGRLGARSRQQRAAASSLWVTGDTRLPGSCMLEAPAQVQGRAARGHAVQFAWAHKGTLINSLTTWPLAIKPTSCVECNRLILHVA
jgi:hypothetical protein